MAISRQQEIDKAEREASGDEMERAREYVQGALQLPGDLYGEVPTMVAIAYILNTYGYDETVHENGWEAFVSDTAPDTREELIRSRDFWRARAENEEADRKRIARNYQQHILEMEKDHFIGSHKETIHYDKKLVIILQDLARAADLAQAGGGDPATACRQTGELIRTYLYAAIRERDETEESLRKSEEEYMEIYNHQLRDLKQGDL